MREKDDITLSSMFPSINVF